MPYAIYRLQYPADAGLGTLTDARFKSFSKEPAQVMADFLLFMEKATREINAAHDYTVLEEGEVDLTLDLTCLKLEMAGWLSDRYVLTPVYVFNEEETLLLDSALEAQSRLEGITYWLHFQRRQEELREVEKLAVTLQRKLDKRMSIASLDDPVMANAGVHEAVVNLLVCFGKIMLK